MRTLDRKLDKVQMICDTLKRETLEPAKTEAEAIIAEARQRAEKIIAEAESEGKRVVAEGHRAIEEERSVFYSSLAQASLKALEALRQTIEQKFFNETVEKLVKSETSEPKVIASIIKAIITSLEREGIAKDLSAIIPEHISASEINTILTKTILHKLKENSVSLGPLTGGAMVKLHEKRMTLEISDQALCEYLSRYVRKEFRKWLFVNSSASG